MQNELTVQIRYLTIQLNLKSKVCDDVEIHILFQAQSPFSLSLNGADGFALPGGVQQGTTLYILVKKDLFNLSFVHSSNNY